MWSLCSGGVEWASMKQWWNDSERGKTKECLCYFFGYNGRMKFSGTEPSKSWHGPASLISSSDIHLLLLKLIFGLILSFICTNVLGFLAKYLECDSFPWLNWTGEHRSNLFVYFYTTYLLFTRISLNFPWNWLFMSKKLKGKVLNWVYYKNTFIYFTFSAQQCLVVAFVIAPLYW